MLTDAELDNMHAIYCPDSSRALSAKVQLGKLRQLIARAYDANRYMRDHEAMTETIRRLQDEIALLKAQYWGKETDA